jgi:predicted DsbA family dithiol-disulfide isomerase
MAAALFAAPVDDLTPEGCEQLAVDVGCDRERYRETLADPAIRDRIAKDTADARAAGVQSFPTVYINGAQFSGAQHDSAELLAALDHVN